MSHTFTSLNLIEEKLAHNWAPKSPLVKCTLISTKPHRDLQPDVHSKSWKPWRGLLCTPGFSDIDFSGPVSLWWLLWILSPRNMHADVHAIWGSLWILWYLSVDPRNFVCVCDAEEHVLYPAAGLLQIMWMPVMSLARESYCVSEFCKILMCLLSPFKRTSQKMLHRIWTGTFLSHQSAKGNV